MPALSFVSYAVYAYVVAPALFKSMMLLYGNRYQICPVVKCIPSLVKCLREDACQDFLDNVQQCSDPTSQARQQSEDTFWFVQHPEDPAFCRYQCFDRLETTTAIEFLECIGSSGCLEPSVYSDVCATFEKDGAVFPLSAVLPLETIQPEILSGKWKKLYTTGWDIWPCQWTEFHPPQSTSPDPEPWMTAWPNSPNVWRMDLFWKNQFSDKVTFHMTNEMYPHQTWEFSSLVEGTLKTKAVMWGTMAHENWYLLDYDAATETMLIYYCAYTQAIDRFDSMAMVLQKDTQMPLTDDQAQTIQKTALRLLGEKHGKLQQIPECK